MPKIWRNMGEAAKQDETSPVRHNLFEEWPKATWKRWDKNPIYVQATYKKIKLKLKYKQGPGSKPLQQPHNTTPLTEATSWKCLGPHFGDRPSRDRHNCIKSNQSQGYLLLKSKQKRKEPYWTPEAATAATG